MKDLLPRTGPDSNQFARYIFVMVNELSEFFRVRQSVHDLQQVILQTSTRSLDRIASLAPPDQVDVARAGLEQIAASETMRFDGAETDAAYDAVRLAAALPAEGFEAFVVATALLLLDRLSGGHRNSDLHWYFEPFSRDYVRALPWHRAAIFNGYRTATLSRALVLDTPVPAEPCFTRSREDILAFLSQHQPGDTMCRLREGLVSDIDPARAGVLWSGYAASLDRSLVPVFRHLYERPTSFETPPGLRSPMIPIDA